MTLADLGWHNVFDHPPDLPPGQIPGRVAVGHRDRYVVYAETGECWAEVTGKLRHDAERGLPPGLPAVGDWVALEPHDGGHVTIRSILPRRGLFARKEAGRRAAAQFLAANIDVAFLVTALPADLNPRRLERYLALTAESGATPVLVLSKADLCPDPDAARAAVEAVRADAPVHLVSAATGDGVDDLLAYFDGNKTVAFLGSSGVGKSTLINRLLGREVLRVQDVRDDGKGRHTTTHRELIARPGGGLVLDTPGMRELALWDGDGVGTAFGEVEELASHCRFRDCTHREEPGCAVRAAVERDELPADRLDGYHKLRAEAAYLETRTDAGARAERKRQERLIHRAAYKWMKEKGT